MSGYGQTLTRNHMKCIQSKILYFILLDIIIFLIHCFHQPLPSKEKFRANSVVNPSISIEEFLDICRMLSFIECTEQGTIQGCTAGWKRKRGQKQIHFIPGLVVEINCGGSAINGDIPSIKKKKLINHIIQLTNQVMSNSQILVT